MVYTRRKSQQNGRLLSQLDEVAENLKIVQDYHIFRAENKANSANENATPGTSNHSAPVKGYQVDIQTYT